jgi:hypothetical protein
MVKNIYKLALQYILVNIRLCPKLMCIWVQNMLWGTEISKIDLSFMKLCEWSIQLWTMYGHTLLKLSNLFYTNLMDKNMLPHQFVIFWPNLDIIVIIFLPILRTLVKQPTKILSSMTSNIYYMKYTLYILLCRDFNFFTYLLFSKL